MDTQIESTKAIIEYAIFNHNSGDYITQAQILKDMNPDGW